MLHKIKLKNFKCFEQLELDCKSLNLLCGLNGMGKSSVIQALLVLRQSFDTGELHNGRLVLGGERIDLGAGSDVLFEGAARDVVGFALQDAETTDTWTLDLGYSRDADQLSALSDSAIKYISAEWQKTALFGGRLVYVNAERVGPRKFYPLSEVLARRGDFGASGEYAWNYLNAHQNDLLPEDDPRCIEGVSRRLLNIVDLWLQDVCPGAHLQLEAVSDADAVIAGFSFDRSGDIATSRYRTTNVGFGLSYVLPVILALLSDRGTLCLIENPEAHLHPRGQTKHGIAVGFPSDPVWDRDNVTVSFNELLPDENIGEAFETIDNLTRSVHALPICERYRVNLRQFANSAALWVGRDEAFPNLVFGPDVEHNLTTLNSSALQIVIKRLASLDASAREWSDTGGTMPSWKCKVTPESQSVRNNPQLLRFRQFKSHQGTQKLFEWHARFGSSGRIHLRFDPGSYEVEIGYIGPHLPL